MIKKKHEIYCDNCELDIDIQYDLDDNSEYQEEGKEVEFCPFCGDIISDEESDYEEDVH